MIYVVNQWNGRQYKCHENDIDASNRWNLLLHDNSQTPILYYKTCGYCGTDFRTRVDLFDHLGFMNIDTRNDYENELYFEDNPVFDRIKHVDEYINNIYLSKISKKKK